MNLVCQATCYMPVIRGGKKIQYRFEDGDVVEGSRDKAKGYLASGNFTEVPPGTGTPILIVETGGPAKEPDGPVETGGPADEPDPPDGPEE